MKKWPLWREWEKKYQEIIRDYNRSEKEEAKTELIAYEDKNVLIKKLRGLADDMGINIAGTDIQAGTLSELRYIDSCIREAIREARHSFLVWAAITSACASVISAMSALVVVFLN